MMTRRLLLLLAGILLATFGLLRGGAALTPGVSPDADTLYTSTRYVTGIAVAPDGAVWASTLGGVLCRAADGWRKFTIRDGLPSNEVVTLHLAEHGVVAVTPLGAARFQEGRWAPEQTPPVTAPYLKGQLASATWRGARYAATLTGVFRRQGEEWEELPHTVKETGYNDDYSYYGHYIYGITALLPLPDRLLALSFQGNIFAYDGARWTLVAPTKIGDATALGGSMGKLWVGTRRNGLWEQAGDTWVQHLLPDEPYDHNTQALALYQGSLYVSTLEDGVAVRAPRGWETVVAMSSDAPRQQVLFAGKLYVRHGNGKVDVYDGIAWKRDVFKGLLPRKEASGLAADGGRLYVAQWGGWSEFDGTAWTHHLTERDLQGIPVIALYPDGEALWIGTQRRGLGEWDRKAQTLRWHDERGGLPDDWIRCLAMHDGHCYAGTFVGGLARRDGDRWTTVPGLPPGEITALASYGGALLIGTRAGLYTLRTGAARRLHSPILPAEIQALCPAEDGVWVGTRTGLCFLTKAAVAP